MPKTPAKKTPNKSAFIRGLPAEHASRPTSSRKQRRRNLQAHACVRVRDIFAAKARTKGATEASWGKARSQTGFRGSVGE